MIAYIRLHVSIFVYLVGVGVGVGVGVEWGGVVWCGVGWGGVEWGWVFVCVRACACMCGRFSHGLDQTIIMESIVFFFLYDTCACTPHKNY